MVCRLGTSLLASTGPEMKIVVQPVAETPRALLGDALELERVADRSSWFHRRLKILALLYRSLENVVR